MHEKNTPLPRLQYFEIENLNGEFSHKITLNIDKHVTAIIAPNGVGKTLCLKIIQSLFERKWHFFETIEFTSIRFNFTDGSKVDIHKPTKNDSKTDISTENEAVIKINFKLPDSKNTRRIIRKVSNNLEWVRRRAPYLRHIEGDFWVDIRDGERIHRRDIDHRFGYRKRRPSNDGLSDNDRKNYEELHQFLSKIKCKLIETQRLIIVEDNDDSPQFPGKRMH